MRICVIGSMTYTKTVEWVVCEFKKKPQYEVWYAKPSKESLEKLIYKAFEEIRKADKVIVVSKPNGSIGVGTLYEKIYAESLGKEVIIL